ncbi:transposase [Rubellimicrobium roseum]|uniref:transposase n=1 Tax=Rubellimicrobium roseum TaxID=687525 RepID=UPI003CCC7336
MSNLYWLTDDQMERLRPFFPKSHGRPRVDDRRVLSGIIFVNRNGLRWRDTPAEYGSRRRFIAAGSAGAAWACSLG